MSGTETKGCCASSAQQPLRFGENRLIFSCDGPRTRILQAPPGFAKGKDMANTQPMRDVAFVKEREGKPA
ncbi:hypothetical protein [Bradyrhizobium iriomotense]|uniref:hypothetical protein n=1 Tax=Bradyrhizobium iriomotense TaxID=441950 RepID=UPI0024E07074|nr:hypothetical protein [Bradyrhizobium iriomotense]